MKHNMNWTPQKIESRLHLIEPLEYRKKHPIPPFRFQTLASPDVEPPIATDIDDSNWPIIEPNTYWERGLQTSSCGRSLTSQKDGAKKARSCYICH